MNPTSVRVRSIFGRSALVAGAAICLCMFLLQASASAATPAPSWKLVVENNATLEPDWPTEEEFPAYYRIMARNTGAEATSGEYTVVDTLPSQVDVDTISPAKIRVSPPGIVCETAKAVVTTVTCKGSESLQAGKKLVIRIPIAVSELATVGEVAVDSAELEGGNAGAAVASLSTPISNAPPSFDFLSAPNGASFFAYEANGQEATQAGSHPHAAISSLSFNWEKSVGGGPVRIPDGGLKDTEVNLPKGLVINPQATPVKCLENQLETESCPAASQVGAISGIISLAEKIGGASDPVFNMKPPHGVPAELGFPFLEEGVYAHIFGKVRSESDYGLSATVLSVPAKVGFLGAEVELWGVPTAAVHDAMRGYTCAVESSYGEECPLKPGERNGKAFISMPTSCEAPLVSSASANSWNSPTDVKVTGSNGAAIAGCSAVEFNPSISSQATTPAAESPSGLNFNLHVPQSGAPEDPEGEEGLATANLKDAQVTLPEGMTVNPSSANGLGVCTAAQIGLKTPIGQIPAHFDESKGGCPNASRIGAVEVTTPLLAEPLTGSVFLAKPFANPFESLLAIYLFVQDEQTGIIAKLPGLVQPNAATGRLTVTFRENPELPIEDVKLTVFNGPKASLMTPLICGSATTTSVLTPWTTPEGADAHPSDSFQTGAGCASSEAVAPKAYSFSAGTESPLSGAFSPFSLRISRPDGSQHITGLETTLPKGLIGKPAGIPYCSESGIALARSREAVERGKEEIASPACPTASEVGTVDVAAGAGITPYNVTGHAYWAGPYKGAPLSLVVIVPAVAGPFDLGDVVDRVALYIDEFSAQVHAVADPLPTIRNGIPLDVRSIELKLSRPGFMLNPTSCEIKAIEGSVSTQAGQASSLKNSFQVGECGRLGFKPKLQISLTGATKKTGHPALKAVLKMPQGGANIGRAQVSLPHSEFLDQGNLNRICIQADLKAGTCPASTIYGKAKAWSPLLDKPLEGNVYLAGGFGYKLPALVAELNGQIRVLLKGKVDTDKALGIRNTFEAVPDAPVERFVLEMKGGKKYGLLENSENLCRKAQKAGVSFGAQNGKVLQESVLIANSCKSGKKGKKKH